MSLSCPIALTTGVPHPATARSSVSLLNGQQILDAAPSPGDHDHVHLGITVQPLQRRDDVGHRCRTLRRRVLDPEPDGR